MRKTIITMDVNVVQMTLVIEKVTHWLKEKAGRYVCVSNVHMCMETYDHEDFRQVVNQADLVVPDGRPIYWAQKWLGAGAAEQIRGYDLTHAICQFAESNGKSVGFYGSSPEVLEQCVHNLKQQYPNLNVNYAYSPPFRLLSEDEKTQIQHAINQSHTDLLFVGLGCPKQEKWMAENKGQLKCVMFGVGAVFDFVAGNKKHAPKWMQKIGLEWFYRLVDEPGRLWRRYLSTNPRFMLLLLKQKLSRN